MAKRYSYSFENASRFIMVYEELIGTFKSSTLNVIAPIRVPSGALTSCMNPNTLLNRMTDGLKWLVENFETAKSYGFVPKYDLSDYEFLRINLKPRVLQNDNGFSGVEYTFKVRKSMGYVVNGIINPNKAAVEEASLMAEPIPQNTGGLRQQVEAFLEDSSKKIEMFRGLVLTDGDKNWLRNLLAGSPQLEHHLDVEAGTLTIVKIDKDI